MYYICVRYSLLIFILFLYCKWDMDERWTKGGGESADSRKLGIGKPEKTGCRKLHR